jgi:hypothetical protein
MCDCRKDQAFEALEGAHESKAKADVKRKAIGQSAKYFFPTSDIHQMLIDIEQGYQR